MSDAKTNTHPHTDEAQFLAPRTRQQAVARGTQKTVVMNGSVLDMVHDGLKWWIVDVQAARPGTRQAQRVQGCARG